MLPTLFSFSLLFASTITAQTHTPTDCKTVNEFLCQTQCGKVLIQCTGVGIGAALEALDEPAAVCNNGKIDFATNCKTNAAAPAPTAAGGAAKNTTQAKAKKPKAAATAAAAKNAPATHVAAVPAAAPNAGAATHTAAECTVANQFLCQTQCGKVLIQCTGVGIGAALEALDEPAAVCNNGKIDFAQNCKV
ncbi:hypothetical protein HDU98_007584 [Podochytrium sp. JEL0797]|nr:hypothetical protein HDU98_007584 [Podochytrium sp. JEL0797]